MTHETTRTSPTQWILKYWVLIVALFLTVGAWTTLNNKVQSQGLDIEGLKASNVSAVATNNQILVQLSAIQTDINWIREKIKDK